MRFASAFAPFVTGLFLIACGGTQPQPQPPPPQAGATTTTPTTTTAQIVSSDDDPGGTAAEVFERAKKAMADGKLAHARTLFDRVVKAESAEHPGAPTSLARAAAYNAALCSEQLGDHKDARDRFAKLAEASAGTADAVDATLRRARIDVELEDWKDLGQAASTLLSSTDLGKFDRAEALALQGLSMLHGGDMASAEKSIGAAAKMLDKKDKPDEIAPPHNAAAVHFARGDLLRAQAEAIVFLDTSNPSAPIVAADFPAKMELRCQKILDAQDAYIESIGTKEVDWAVRSGVRVASMYGSLHDAVIAIPPPKSATTEEKKQLFKGAMRLRYRILLEKGVGTLDRTINLEKAASAKTTWLDQAKKAKTALEKQLADTKAELAKLPYTEAQLQKALDDLGKKGAKS